jgi:hypothetical protein
MEEKESLKIISCTSQSDVHDVLNILNRDTIRRWETKENADKAIVELQFEKPTKIKSIEIGLLSIFFFNATSIDAISSFKCFFSHFEFRE